MEKIWLKQYPAGVPAEIDVAQYSSLVALLDESFQRYADRTAYLFMGKAITFRQVDEASRAFAAWLQAQGFAKGDRVAVMMPNVPQYPVAVAAILRAGLVVVNVNPLYTPRELEHQLKDSGARAIVVLENFAARAGPGDGGRADQDGGARLDGRHARLSQVDARQLRRAQGEEARAGVRDRRRGALQRRARRRAAARRSGRCRSAPTTSPCCSTPAARPASARARCCCIATSSPTSCRPRPGTSRR